MGLKEKGKKNEEGEEAVVEEHEEIIRGGGRKRISNSRKMTRITREREEKGSEDRPHHMMIELVWEQAPRC